jgi:two-component system sensor histidine kinase ChvG
VNLRRQLLLVSLLLLSLPWAGCQFIREMEGALRQGQMQSLQATAQAVAAVLEQQVELIYPYPARRSVDRSTSDC